MFARCEKSRFDVFRGILVVVGGEIQCRSDDTVSPNLTTTKQLAMSTYLFPLSLMRGTQRGPLQGPRAEMAGSMLQPGGHVGRGHSTLIGPGPAGLSGLIVLEQHVDLIRSDRTEVLIRTCPYSFGKTGFA